jgi:glycerate dehydrogenase
MTHQVVFLDRDSLKAKVRSPNFATSYQEYPHSEPHQVLDRLAQASVVITNKVPLRSELLRQLPKLKMIAVAATGYDIIDIPYCREQGIAVANIRNYAIRTVPEHTFALILALRRNLLAYQNDVQNGLWSKSKQFCLFTHPITDLHGSTLGIIGEGTLGQGVAKIAQQGFGMNVQFLDHSSSRKKEVTYVSLDTLLNTSDVISLHCPLTPATRHLIGLNELRKMKSTAILVNTSRGGLVDESALIQALEEGWIAGAGFDVLTEEPPPENHPLLAVHRQNFILTPHVAWASNEAMQGLADQLIDNIEAWHQGKPQHLVT